jgi:putative tributyrin esterase
MALIEFRMGQRNALNRPMAAVAIVPDPEPNRSSVGSGGRGSDGNGSRPPYPVLYLLHGRSDDHTAWVRNTNIERFVRGLPLIVVMPDGGRGFWTDSRSSPTQAHETALLRDLIGFVDSTFQTVPTRAGRAIGGLSMGGYGAVKLALKPPDLFCAAFSLSGAFTNGSKPYTGDSEEDQEMRPIFGSHPEGGTEDVFALAAAFPSEHGSGGQSTELALRLDCGTEDFFLPDNRRLHAHLDVLGLAHEYTETRGGHKWASPTRCHLSCNTWVSEYPSTPRHTFERP